jgi:hypothetical protein
MRCQRGIAPLRRLAPSRPPHTDLQESLRSSHLAVGPGRGGFETGEALAAILAAAERRVQHG